jgi:hypothetical protein
MTPLLTDEQRLALHAANDRGPVTIVDLATNRTYVPLRGDIYERCEALLTEDELTVAEAYRPIDEIAGRLVMSVVRKHNWKVVDPVRMMDDGILK